MERGENNNPSFSAFPFLSPPNGKYRGAMANELPAAGKPLHSLATLNERECQKIALASLSSKASLRQEASCDKCDEIFGYSQFMSCDILIL